MVVPMAAVPTATWRSASVRAFALAAFAAGAWSVAANCAPAPAPVVVPAWPAGTVLVLNDVPITATEVDAIAGTYARLEPGFVEAHCRRLALTNAVFPLIAAQGIDPDARAKAKALADEYARTLGPDGTMTGPATGPMPFERKGTWKRVGLEAWMAAVDRQDAHWTPVMETPGAYQMVRLLGRGKQSVAQELELELSVLEFPYLQGNDIHQQIETALDRSRLVFVDPAWRDYVPSAWQHRLHANTP